MDGPVPSLSAGPKGDSPEELMQFLEAIILKSLSNVDRISKSEKPAWVTLVMELSEHFLASFPPSGTGIWSAYSEKTKLSLASLEVIQGSARLVEDFLLVNEQHSHVLIMRILKFALSVASWCDSHSEPCGPPELCPRSVHRKAVETFEMVVEGLKIAHPSDWSSSPFVEKCMDSMVSYLRDSLGSPESLSSLSKFESIVLNEDTDLDVLRIDIESTHQFSQVLGDLVLFTSRLYSSDFISSSAKLKHYRELCTLVRRLVDVFLSQSMALPLRVRSEALSMVIRASALLYSLQGHASDMVGLLPTTVLLKRLREGPNVDWDTTDRELLLIFGKGRAAIPLFNHSMLLAASQEQWGDEGELLRDISYAALDKLLPLLDSNALQSLSQLLAKRTQSDKVKAFYEKVRERLEHANPVLGKRKRDDDSWKSAVVTLLESEVYDGPCGTQFSDQGLDSGWRARVLDELKKKLSQPLRNSSRGSRLRTLKALQKLPCLLSHPEEKDCLRASSKLAISIIPCYLTCISKLLKGPETEVDSSIRKSGQDAMANCLRHHSKGYGEDHLDAVVEFIRGGMGVEERSIRLAAGRALVELVRLYCGIGRGASRRVDNVFEYISSLLKGKDTIQETTLVSLGLIGRLPDADILGRVLCRLFLQLGGPNILLRGAAYCQILSLTTFHNKTPYLLLSPYLPTLAPLIASSLVFQPNLLTETCRFLSLSPSDFLSVTLQHTLPHLFATCNAEALRKLSQEVGQNISALFLNASPYILAHVFSLSGSAESEKSINFITRTLTEATKAAKGDSKIDIQTIVRSCLISLLGLLIISMGDESRIVADNAATAIARVERAMNPLSGVPKKKTNHHLGSFLKDYTLGIITNLSDVLQDVQGRKSEATKRSVLRGLASLIRAVGPPINTVAPQIMATLQTTVNVPPLAEVALRTWNDFLVTLDVRDLGPHVGPTTATLVNVWSQLSTQSREIAKKCASYIASDVVKSLGEYVNEIADFSAIPELIDCANKVVAIRSRRSTRERLIRILDRCSSDNVTVVCQALEELRVFMTVQHEGFIRELASGDVFDPLVGDTIRSLLCIACRDGEGADMIRLLAFDCIGIIGAVDPDRFDLPADDPYMVVLNNFTDENEAIQFALHLIENALVGAFRSTSDIKYQSQLAYAIQELLKFCNFTPDLITPGTSVPNKIRNRWNDLPKHVLETVTPLLEGRFAVHNPSDPVVDAHPIYHGQSTYREWIQLWCSYLISKAQGVRATAIFEVFRAVLRNRDVGIAHQLLPHLVLNVLISDDERETRNIQLEITAVLQDQLNSDSDSSSDKKLLSSQVIFMLMDHLNKWIRRVRQEISARRNESKRARNNSIDDMDIQLTQVDSILANIDQDLIAKAAFECKSFARALMNFEKQIVILREREASQEVLEAYYEKLHEIYAHLDEPDGMEGISTFITFPSIEHQIRQHENTGKWTSAQSCWEVRVQQSPDQLDNHLGLLRCLRNLGHYDSLRTHIQGVVVRYPHLEPALAGFKIEGLLMNNDWDNVETAMASMQVDTWETAMARLLLAMRSKDRLSFRNALSSARMQFGTDISAAGQRGYRRAYDSFLKLHLVRDIEIIHDIVAREDDLPADDVQLNGLFLKLSSRMESTLPTFRTREPILSMHRTTFSLNQLSSSFFKRAIGQAWLESSKIARKAGHWQTAYSAVLRAQESKAPFSFVQLAKLSKASGESLRALIDLEHALRNSGEKRTGDSGASLDEEAEAKRLLAKAKLLRVRWMRESDRYDINVVANELSNLAKSLKGMENAHFHSGNFQDDCYKALSLPDKRERGLKMAVFVIRAYASAIRAGNKYIFQTIPRLITIWLDVAEESSESEQFTTINNEVLAAVQQTPVYKWLSAFPQIISRVDHKNKKAYNTLAILISSVLQEYPQQALWQFVSVVKSTKLKREKRGRDILDQLKANPRHAGTRVPTLVDQAERMATELLNLCDLPIKDNSTKVLSLSRHCPALARLVPSDMIIPLQESMTASLPPTSSAGMTHQPFPADAPTIAMLFEDIEVMNSLAKPRKITIEGSDGQIYMFLGKPKDDLRKDARLMDFNSMINKLLRSNSDSRRRRLHIRTYSVVTLNEECGFIQWVPNTMPIRPILVKYYNARGVEAYSREMAGAFAKIKEATDKEASKIFNEKILSLFPPLFHEWFLDTFPEPTAWLSSRLSYGRTAAVMSMVGFILGLGDRHLENILLDVVSGDIVHVDFNCLFEKGKTLETPERVPFRLTNNIVDALGVTGVEGTFRKSCEITMQLLRDNKDSLMSVLDAFIHDPLVEWEDEKRKLEKQARSDRNAVKDSADLRKLAKNALQPIEKKLKGLYAKEPNRNDRRDKEVSTSNLVQTLIEEATDKRNLGKMYPGWAPWH